MTAAQLYDEIIRQNPTFEREGATLSAAGLRKLILTCYRAGRLQGQRDIQERAPGSMPPFMAELFRGFRQ
jgi:hypothetical protein